MRMLTMWRLLVAAGSSAAALSWAAPLPADVEMALERANVPRDALVAWVQETGTGVAPPRLAWQAQQPVNPASLMKLLTTSAALDLLGPAWTWGTPVWLQGPVVNGVLDGNLVIKGTGDPKLVQERIWQMLRRIQQLGVREIRGDIVIDRSAFTLPPHNPASFDSEPYRPSNVGPDALLINYKSLLLTFTPDIARGMAIVSSEPPLAGVRIDVGVPLAPGNCDDWRGGLRADLADPQRIRFNGNYPTSCGEKQWPMAYADPASFNARMLAGLWREMGGKLIGRGREGKAPAEPPTFEITSPALAELIRDINKFSNNVMAQQLFLTLGLTQRGIGSPDAAREVMRQWLGERFGDAATRGVVIDNGSGLSRDARVTALLLARLLQASWGGPAMPELMSSMPVSGVDGTLRRARNAVTGRAHLKTGSLRDVAGLAGYVLSPSGKRYVLVAIINHPNANAARPALEALVQWTANDPASALLPPAPPPTLRPAVPPAMSFPVPPAAAASEPSSPAPEPEPAAAAASQPDPAPAPP